MLAMMQMPFEFGAFLASMPVLPTLQRGDGHPVLVMPGFMGGDSSTLPLRSFLWSWGYDVHGFGERPNPGPTRGGARRAQPAARVDPRSAPSGPSR